VAAWSACRIREARSEVPSLCGDVTPEPRRPRRGAVLLSSSSLPLLLRARVGGRERKHVPDYLLLSDEGPVVVDVKPQSRLSKQEVSFTLAWTRELVEQRGWRYEVWSEPPEAELGNVRFLAGYRHERRFDRDLLDELRAGEIAGQSLGEACRGRGGWPAPLVRSAVFHLVWTHHFTVDLTRPLSAALVVGCGVRA